MVLVCGEASMLSDLIRKNVSLEPVCRFYLEEWPRSVIKSLF